ncbi:Crp/Fnr family transcriptional regulator [Sulfitobacter sp. SK012]|uniref:Crp/Fnr family transcriptional regulator n=1 Tax=Sulfitobacter sp. SK012 TaxID=1389005 RepID=UPI000E0A3ECF|nr:Crp/Fnr family transcriptional regulator [Sulfitobacter sp. SK012]AXI48848.1 Crp/Fnr family transcriptional regulator [Sulfitobacter sp. SK012]
MEQTDLPETGFLFGASTELRTMLKAQATKISMQAGETLFEQGDKGGALFAVTAGSIEISVLERNGRKLGLAVMRPGALFGEIALFDPGDRTATATAIEPSNVLRVKNLDVLEQVRKKPELAVDLIHLAGQRMRWMGRQLHEQVFLPMPTRLARKVLYLTPERSKGLSKLNLSQAELAEFVGATREAVSKTLAAWNRIGLIEASRGGLMVLDRSALKVLAEPDQI